MNGVLRCTVAWDREPAPRLLTLQLPAGADVAAALAAACGAWPELVPVLADAAVGVFGECCRRDRLLQDGERVEIYRPLPRDPKQQRRVRAAAARAGGVRRRGR